MISNRLDNTDSTILYVLALPSKADSLIQVESLADNLKDRFELSDEVYANILTCLSEVTNNAIVHGNKEDETKNVSVKVELVENSLMATITDQGPGFNYNNLPDPTDPENLENLTGRGLFIVKQLADQCIFNSGGNQVVLSFNI